MKLFKLLLICFISLVVFVNSSAQDFLASDQDFLSTDGSAYRLQSGFIGGIDFSTGPSFTAIDTKLMPTVFSLRAGYKFGYTAVSGIMGIEYLNKENFIPLGIEARRNFSGKVWTPFAYVQTGYSFHLKRNIHSRYYTANYAQYKPSFYAKGGVGYSYATNMSEFIISVGFLYHELEEVVAEQAGDRITDLTMNGVVLTIGFVF